MDGIMVLNSMVTPEYGFGWNNWCLLLIIPLLLGLYLILFWFVNRDNRRSNKAFKWGLIGLCIVALSLIIGLGICSCQNVTYDKTYQVILNNDVDMISFRENYEIIEQVGITYIVRLK